MLDAAFKAIAQMFSPPFRKILLKSAGMALLLIIVAAIGLHRVLAWFAEGGQAWLQTTLGLTTTTPLTILSWVISIAAALGIVAGSIFLMPAVTGLLASFFADDVAEQVERRHYPGDPPGHALPIFPAALQGLKTAMLAILVYLVALPSLLLAGIGVVIFFLATAFLLSREYFELAAMRFNSPADARKLRKANQSTVMIAGLFLAAFVSIPILNLATPLFGTAFMVHVYKRLAGRPTSRPLLEGERAS
ncbi:MAG TPA: sulfate transporter family protein [Xanthobacteraceae bacterium]|nr:sulfate transporter family protein [Xanthobacteraceae bacterium]